MEHSKGKEPCSKKGKDMKREKMPKEAEKKPKPKKSMKKK